MAPENNAQPENTPVAAQQPTENVPSSWPGAFQLYRYSAQAVKRNIWLLVEIWVVYFAFRILVSLVKPNVYATLVIAILMLALSFAVSVLTTNLLIAGVRGKSLSTSEAFSGPLPMLTLKMLGLNIIVGFTLMLSLIALVIPFFFVFPRLILANYFLVDKNMGPLEAFNASWRATKGHTGKVWGIAGASFLMALLMLTIIGIPVAIYLLLMYSAAYAVLYEMIGKLDVPAAAATAPATPPIA